MSLIATVEIETPILQTALNAVPDMVLVTEDLRPIGEDPTRSVIWAEGDSFERFEGGLEADPTIAGYKLLTEIADRRLYRITYTGAAEAAFTYPVIVEHDITLLKLTGSHERLEIRARFPSRDALYAYREACRERDIPFRLQRLYREEDVAEDGAGAGRYGLTDPQREALRLALEMGYFDVPRATTQEAIADELGISEQALSTRLRRGQRALLGTTLARGPGT